MLMMVKKVASVERAESLLPIIDSIFCGTLSGKEAEKSIREGELVLRELKQLKDSGASIKLLIESLDVSIELAKKEIEE